MKLINQIKKNIFRHSITCCLILVALFLANITTKGVTALAELPDYSEPSFCVTDNVPPPSVKNDLVVREYSSPVYEKKQKQAKIEVLSDPNIIPANVFKEPPLNKNDTVSLEKNDQNIQQIKEDKEGDSGILLNKSKTPAEKNPIFRIMSSLSVVLIAVIIFLWIFSEIVKSNPQFLLKSKLNADKKSISNKTNKLEILSTASLGQGKTIHLVKVNKTQIVIGSTQNNVSMISIINETNDRQVFEQIDEVENKEQDETINEEKPIKNDEVSFDDEDLVNLDGYCNLYQKYLHS